MIVEQDQAEMVPYQLVNDIPVPRSRRAEGLWPGGSSKYTWVNMLPGDSFWAPTAAAVLLGAATGFSNRRGLSWKWKVRTEGSLGGIGKRQRGTRGARIWRVE
jgi:hypothetical protein